MKKYLQWSAINGKILFVVNKTTTNQQASKNIVNLLK